MELDQLRYFTAVAELLSFTRAAERCLVSQPSLSQQIIKLESELGAPLLERLGRTVRLTDAGRTFYDHAVRVLAATAAARDSLQSADHWRSGRLAVGAILTVAPYLLPPAIRAFSRRFPEARLTVREDFTAGILRACAAGELDLGLTALPVDDPRLQVEPLFTEELLVALPEKHPLAKKRKLIAADLAGQAFVLLDDTHCLGAQVLSFCHDRQWQPTVACRTAQLLTVQSMVGLGQGVSLVPQMAVDTDRRRGIVYRSLGPDAPHRTIAAIRHPDRRQSPLVQEFLQLLREHKPSPSGRG